MLRRRDAFAWLAVFLLGSNSLVVRPGNGAPSSARAPRSSRLQEVMLRLREQGIDLSSADLQQRVVKSGDRVEFSCSMCVKIFEVVQFLLGLSWTEDAIADAVGELCTLFKIEHETVCKGIAQSFKVRMKLDVA